MSSDTDIPTREGHSLIGTTPMSVTPAPMDMRSRSSQLMKTWVSMAVTVSGTVTSERPL